MTANPLLEITDLVAGYVSGVDILRGCSVTVGQGELVGVIGPNGAGKSTLVKAAIGLVPARAGRVTLRQDDLSALPPHRRVELGIAYVPQTANVFRSLTVAENLRMGAYLSPDRWEERSERVGELFGVVASRRHQRAGSLSGGEQQVVAMARALMTDPSVLLLDEPSASLSPANQQQVFDHIATVNEAGLAILMVEQNARRCLELADRAYVLDQGRNAHQGTGEELLDDPAVIDLYLGTLGRR